VINRLFLRDTIIGLFLKAGLFFIVCITIDTVRLSPEVRARTLEVAKKESSEIQPLTISPFIRLNHR
jgi:hypothetical protein